MHIQLLAAGLIPEHVVLVDDPRPAADARRTCGLDQQVNLLLIIFRALRVETITGRCGQAQAREQLDKSGQQSDVTPVGPDRDVAFSEHRSAIGQIDHSLDQSERTSSTVMRIWENSHA